MKKLETTILWLVQANNALREVENHLRELNYELDKQQDINIENEVRSEYGPDKVDRIMEFVTGELGEARFGMTIREVMDEIGGADMCEWCGETTIKHASEIMTWLGDEKICVYCKSNG